MRINDVKNSASSANSPLEFQVSHAMHVSYVFAYYCNHVLSYYFLIKQKQSKSSAFLIISENNVLLHHDVDILFLNLSYPFDQLTKFDFDSVSSHHWQAQ